MRQILLIFVLMFELGAKAQMFKVGHFISMDDDWLVAASGGVDGPFCNRKNAYTGLVGGFGKVFAGRFYTEKRGFRVDLGYHWQDALRTTKSSMVHNTNTITLTGNETWNINALLLKNRGKVPYLWDFYYGAGFSLLNTHDLVTVNGKANTTQKQIFYPLVQVGTVFRYPITNRAEAFADLSCQFTSTNLDNVNYGSHIYAGLGIGVIWHIPAVGLNRYRVYR